MATEVEFFSATEENALQEQFASLRAQADDPPFFLSASWIKSAQNVRQHLHSTVVLTRAQPDQQALGLIGRRQRWTGGVVGHFNETGDKNFDRVYAERNDFFCGARTTIQSRATAIKEILESSNGFSCLEFHRCRPIVYEAALKAAAETGWCVSPPFTTMSYAADLNQLRDAGGDYCSTLGRATRARVRRSRRLYETFGELHVEPAAGDAKMTAWRRLVEMHKLSWSKRRQKTIMNDPQYIAFHTRLIESNEANIDLLNIRAGDDYIGVLYLFTTDKAAHYYQSGFACPLDNRYLPGFVSHALAIEHYCRASTLERYDFLGGYGDYKSSLGAFGEPMLTFSMHNGSLPERFFAAFSGLRSEITRRRG